MTASTCPHGYRFPNCPLCSKTPDECDFGGCTAISRAVLVVAGERRRMCEDHALRAGAIYGGQVFLDLVSQEDRDALFEREVGDAA